MQLLDYAKQALRVTSDMTDEEIQIWIDAGIADMRRCGVRDELLEAEVMDPIVRAAVICFVKAQYGYDNAEAVRFMQPYTSMLTGLLNSKSNEYLFPEE